MSDAPERVWVMAGDSDGWDGPYVGKYAENGSTEYIRADLMPRWRQIAELPDEWKDGRDVIVRDAQSDDDGKLWLSVMWWQSDCWVGASEWFDIDDMGEFLDFGGHAMPAYDGKV